MFAGKEASHGLDMSFVTHIFLLDEIWDKSLKDQVVARAYRMGTATSVVVEQLVAKGSIEEEINKMNKDSARVSVKDEESDKVNVRKLHGLMKQLKVIRAYEGKARNAAKRVRDGGEEAQGKEEKRRVKFS